MKKAVIAIKNSIRINLAIVLALVVVSGVSFAMFGITQGPDFDNSRVLQVVFDHEEQVDRVGSLASEVKDPVKIEKEGTSIFRLFYQNISDEELDGVLSKLKDNASVLRESSILNHVPGESLIVNIDAAVRTAGIIFLIAMVYAVLSLRNLNFTRLRIVIYMLADIAVSALGLVVLVGIVSALGGVGVPLDNWLVAGFIIAFGIFELPALYATVRFRDIREKNTVDNIFEIWRQLVDEKWQEFVLIASLTGIVSILPLVALGTPLIYAVALLLQALILGVYAHLLVMPYVLKILERLGHRFNLDKKFKFLSSKW